MKAKLTILLFAIVSLSACTMHTKLVYDTNGCAYMFSMVNTHHEEPKDWGNSTIYRVPDADKPTCAAGVKDVQNY